MPVTGSSSGSNMGELAEQGLGEVPKRSKSGSMKSRSGSVKGKVKSSGSVKKQTKSSSGEDADDSSKIEMLTPKQNGTNDESGDGEDKKEKPSSATIKGMWKKAVKNLKSNEKQNWLTKKGSLIRRKDSKEEEIETSETKVVDPVYSLLKCAADLPKSSTKSSTPTSSMNPNDPKCSGHHRGDSSSNTSKGSSPSSSGSQQVTPGLGSDFKEYYKLTSPAKKSSSAFDNIF